MRSWTGIALFAWMTGCADESSSARSEHEAVVRPDIAPAADDAPRSAIPAPPTPSVFTIHLAENGDDTREGLTPEAPVASLARALAVLKAKSPAVDVEIRIKQGTYRAAPMKWDFYVPDHRVSFLPSDYVAGGGASSIAARPVFRNLAGYPRGFWLQPVVPATGAVGTLGFFYLQVEYYSAGGISIDGDRGPEEDTHFDPPLRIRGGTGLNGHRIFGMLFRRLGNRWATGNPFGYGAIVLTNSSDNDIQNNHFVEIENSAAEGGKIHGLYVTHFSAKNVISNNEFERISGDPVKVRNMSNYNKIEKNTFVRSGRASFYRDEFCDTACARTNHIARQCASYGNRFFSNKLVSDYDGDDSSEAWTLDEPGLTYAGQVPCAMPAGEKRLYTGNNSTH